MVLSRVWEVVFEPARESRSFIWTESRREAERIAARDHPKEVFTVVEREVDLVLKLSSSVDRLED